MNLLEVLDHIVVRSIVGAGIVVTAWTVPGLPGEARTELSLCGLALLAHKIAVDYAKHRDAPSPRQIGGEA